MYQRYNPPTVSRRTVQPERISTTVPERSTTYDSYPRSAREGYTSPRSSVERVIPVSTETYVNGVPVSSSRASAAYDDYDDRNRRPVYPEHGLPPAHRRVGSATTDSKSSRLLPAIVHDSGSRQRSPMPRPPNAYDSGYHTTTASSSGNELRKVYSVEDGPATRVDSDAGRDGKRRDSQERRRREGGKRKEYHLSGARPEASGSFEYTDPRGMYNETEPRWRSRGGSFNRDRPTSVYDPYDFPRTSARDNGPPPATRGLDKIKDGLSRSGSAREAVRSPPRDQARERSTRDDGYDDPPRAPLPRHDPQRYRDYDEGYDDRRHASSSGSYDDRRGSKPPVPYYADREVATRGFGIRSDTGVDFTPHEHARDSISVDPLSRVPAEVPRKDVVPDAVKIDDRRVDDRRVDDRRVDDRRDDVRDNERTKERERPRDKEREKERDLTRPRERDARDYEREREYSDYDNDKGSATGDRERYPDREREPARDPGRAYDRDRRPRDHDRDSDRERYSDEDRKRDRADSQRGWSKSDHGSERSAEPLRDADDDHRSAGLTGAALTAAAAATAYGVHQHEKKKKNNNEKKREPRAATVEDDPDDDGSSYTEPREAPAPPAPSSDVAVDMPKAKKRDSPDRQNDRERHYAARDEPAPREEPEQGTDEVLDADAEYRRRMQQEMEKLRRPPVDSQRDESDESRSKAAVGDRTDDTAVVSRPRRDRARERDRDRSDSSGSEGKTAGERGARRDSILDQPLVDEPAQVLERGENRVRIVEPPREKSAPKGILRKPTEKFPDYPDAAREGVAPLKDSKKSDAIPEGAKWTKISRDLVNPAALVEGNERFEERKDVVIVLRVLTKDEVQEYADRTQEIRVERDRHRDRRDRRHHHHHRGGHHDDEDRDDDNDS